MSEYFVKVSPDGQIKIIEYTGEVELFHFLRDQIGCSSIETVKCLTGFNHLMVVDECFLMKCPQPSFNAVASYCYSQFEYAIMGDVVFGCQGFRDGEPDIVGFTLSESMRLVSKIKRIQAAIECIK